MIMINNSSIGKWKRLSQKQQDVQFMNKLQQGMNGSPFESKAILNCVYEVLFRQLRLDEARANLFRGDGNRKFGKRKTR
jgi:hypothetical protein